MESPRRNCNNVLGKDRSSAASSSGASPEDPGDPNAKRPSHLPTKRQADTEEAEVDMEVLKEQGRIWEEQAKRSKQAAEAEAAQRALEMAEAGEDRRAWEEEQAWLRSIDQPAPWYRRLWRSIFRSGGEPEVPPRRFLFACDLGDPITSVQVGQGGACMAGSAQGRIWMLAGDGGAVGSTVPPLGAKYSTPPPRADLLAGWSDEGVRGLYLDDEHGHATFMESCRGWKRSRPHSQTANIRFRDLERKNTQVVKHVLQHGPWVCVLFPLSTSLVHVVRRELVQRQCKLFDYGSSTDVAPSDFDGEQLLIVDRSRIGCNPIFHLVHLASNTQTELDNLPDACWISVVKLWGPDCVAAVVGSSLHIYDVKKKQLRHTLRGHNSEILAVDASDGSRIVTLASDGVIKLWSGSTGACLRTVCVPGANFYLSYPYCLSAQDSKVAFSCDEGVYMVELGPTEPLSDVV